MKKLGILVMAMVLVCGLSLGVMASAGNLENNNVTDTINTSITIEQYADVSFDDGTSLSVTIDEPNAEPEGGAHFSNFIEFKVQTNTDVFAYIDDAHPELKDEDDNTVNLDSIDGKVQMYNGDSVGTHVGQWDDTENGSFPGSGDSYSTGVALDGQAEHTKYLALLGQWRDGDNDAWYEIADGTYTGTVTLTVEAQ